MQGKNKKKENAMNNYLSMYLSISILKLLAEGFMNKKIVTTN
jgi:hypothetical protein